MIKQTVLPFKLEETKDLVTSHAGLALLGEFAVGLGLLAALDKSLALPGSDVHTITVNSFPILDYIPKVYPNSKIHPSVFK